MAEVIGIVSGIITAGQMLEKFGHQTRKWGRLSERLFDIRGELYIAEVAIRNWKRKYRIDNQPADIKNRMLRILFGRNGSEQIILILGSIAGLLRVIKGDIKRLVGRALQVRSGWIPVDDSDKDFDDEALVEDCLRRIRANTSWSRKFAWSVFGKADELERKVNRLDVKVGNLERLSDLLLETEHPGIFEAMRRLPGRRHIPKISDGADGVSKHVKLQRFAELLHRASYSPRNQVHIGLSVPQIDSRDFDFLLNLHGESHEVLARPVRFKDSKTIPDVKPDFSTAVPALQKQKATDSSLLIRPSSASSDGFKLLPTTRPHLLDLEHKESLATTINAQNGTTLGSQILYSQDQNAIASGIARGSNRLIGSPWLDFLDSSKVRWRCSHDGDEWTTMLTVQADTKSTTRQLNDCLSTNRESNRRDLAKHVQIFRIGLVLAEVALKQPISYVDFDPQRNAVKLYINTHEEVDAVELAALVDRKCNVLVGNMVLFCLGALQDRERMRDRAIEDAFYRDVLRDAKELDGMVRRSGAGEKSPVF